MSIKLSYIGEYLSAQVLKYSGWVLKYLSTQELSLRLSISLSAHRKHHRSMQQKYQEKWGVGTCQVL